MPTHDPMALLGDPLSTPSPWESLARQARALADLADRYADIPPADLAPAADEDDPLAELDARALAVRSVVAACRRSTWQALTDDGLSMAEIGRRWGVSRAAVNNALNNRDRPR